MDIKYFTKQALIEANQEAIDKGFTKKLTEKHLNQLDEELRFPIVFHVSSTTQENIEAELLVSPEKTVWLELTSSRFDSLPHLAVDSSETENTTLH